MLVQQALQAQANHLHTRANTASVWKNTDKSKQAVMYKNGIVGSARDESPNIVLFKHQRWPKGPSIHPSARIEGGRPEHSFAWTDQGQWITSPMPGIWKEDAMTLLKATACLHMWQLDKSRNIKDYRESRSTTSLKAMPCGVQRPGLAMELPC